MSAGAYDVSRIGDERSSSEVSRSSDVLDDGGKSEDCERKGRREVSDGDAGTNRQEDDNANHRENKCAHRLASS